MFEVMTASDKKRFWEKVNKNGPIPKHRPELGHCWIWTSGKDRYGEFWLREFRSARVHVLSWEMSRKRKFPKGFCVCHKCDTSRCIRPEHLFKGTHADNKHDSMKKGRHARGKMLSDAVGRGEANHCSKRTNKEVVAIRNCFARKVFGQLNISIRGIARKFGVDSKAVRGIVYGWEWMEAGGITFPRERP